MTRRASEEQIEMVLSYCKGKSVVDFGSGNLEWSFFLAESLMPDQKTVLSIDRYDPPASYVAPGYLSYNLLCKRSYFVDMTPKDVAGYDVGFISWPPCYNTHNLPELLDTFDLVIYQGCNVRGNACGSELLWESFLRREVLEYIPKLNNTLIVYGAPCSRREQDDLYPEEIAATHKDEIFPFNDSRETLNQLLGK
jgi:hypothetical protein